MGIKRLSVSELRLDIRDVLEGVKFRNERYVIITYGRPMAVIVNVEEWERLSGEPVIGNLSFSGSPSDEG